MNGKWKGLEDDRRYELVDLGRPANFLLPSHKLRHKLGAGTIEDHLHAYLARHFKAFTTTTFPTAGFWRDRGAQIVYDECRQYEVSFAGKTRIPGLLAKLSQIAQWIGEDCIYFKAGQYTCLVYPPKQRTRR